MITTFIYTLTTWVVPLLLCMMVHEVAHGLVAYKLGDKTAYYAGRLNFNPLNHLDPIGSLLLPGLLLLLRSPILFGWAKPVPVDFRNLNHPKRDMGLVAAAGPISNLLLAIAFALVGRLLLWGLPLGGHFTHWMIENIRNGIGLSLALGIFNLLPILPLDGGRIVCSLLPVKYSVLYQQTEKYGFLILLGLLFVLPLFGIDIVRWFIGTLYPLFLRLVYLFM